jgi:WD40 repeat protein
LAIEKAKEINQPNKVSAVAVSSDGIIVVSGCSTDVGRLFEVSGAEPKELHSFTQQTTRITALTFSTRQVLLAGCKDGRFLSWNLDVNPSRAVPWPK